MSVLQSGMISEGETAARLQAAAAARYGFAHALVTGSGSQALALALRAAGVGPNTNVVTPTYVCPEVLGVIEALGANAVLADVGEDYLLDPLDPALTSPSLAAIVVPAILGSQADARRYKSAVPVIADWAQYAPARSGDAADKFNIAISSFEATKVLAGGEGGVVLVNDETLFSRLESMKRVADTQLKLNLYPLSDLQAALALSQLQHLDVMLTRRRAIAEYYNKALAGVGRARPSTYATMHYRYVLQVAPDAIDDVIQKFAALGITVRRPVSVMLHQIRPQQCAFPVAEKLFASSISLPLYPSLSDEQVERVADAALKVLS